MHARRAAIGASRGTSPLLPVWHCKTVGGTTVHWTASAPRLQPWELRARTTYGSVAGASLIDWPISYEELEKYYKIAEHRLGVTRRKRRSRLACFEQFQGHVRGERRSSATSKCTPATWPSIRAAFDGRGYCIQQGFCVQGCKIGAKWSTLLHGNSASRSDRESGPADRIPTATKN